MQTFFASIFVLGILIFFHELGHFIIAKWVGIKVNEFSLGFGPKFVDFKRGETIYSVRVFPLGGFVKLEGEDEKTEDERGFSNKPIWQRISVVSAGPFMNFVLALILLWIIGFFTGITTNVIHEITPGGPADVAGLKPGDRIIQINDYKVDEWDEVVSIISRNPGKELTIGVMRGTDIEQYQVVPETVKSEMGERGIIGIKSQILKRDFLKSLQYAFKRVIWVIVNIIAGIVLMIQKRAAVDIIGPVGIIYLVGEAARFGIFDLLSLASFISINLGLFNLLPIPALDGGRIFFILVELVRGKPLDPNKEGLIHFIGFAILMLLMFLVLFKDIVRFNLL